MTYDENSTHSPSPNGREAHGDGGPGHSPRLDARPVVDQERFIHLALGELTPRQRFVVECRHGWRNCRPLKFSEIAALMGVNHPAVVKLYQRAIARIRLNHLGMEHSPVSRGLGGQSSSSSAQDPMTEEHPVGGEEPGVCLSPFLPERYGVQPGSWPNGLLEWYLEQEAHGSDS